MARSRNIKPGFFTNDILGELTPLHRLLFAGMWCHADREGRLLDRPKKLKAEILPYDNVDCNVLIQDLHCAGMVLRYVIDNVEYIQIVNFRKHQNPHIKEPPSSIPAPLQHGASTMQKPVQHDSSPADSLNLIPDSLNLIPDSLKKRKTKNFGATRFNGQPLTAEWEDFCRQERPDLDPVKTFETFRDYWISVPGAKGKKLNWDATWRNWVRRAYQEKGKRVESSVARSVAILEEMKYE